jgi:hypothetical protein
METGILNPQFIKGPDGKPIGVYLSIQEWENIIDELEELEDAASIREFQNNPDQETIPFRQAMDEIKKGLLK